MQTGRELLLQTGSVRQQSCLLSAKGLEMLNMSAVKSQTLGSLNVLPTSTEIPGLPCINDTTDKQIHQEQMDNGLIATIYYKSACKSSAKAPKVIGKGIIAIYRGNNKKISKKIEHTQRCLTSYKLITCKLKRKVVRSLFLPIR